MKGLTIRLLKNKNLIEDNEQGNPVFKKSFTKKELNHNKHYYNRAKNIIVQVNDEYNHIDCHAVFFHSQIAYSLNPEEYLELIKNIVYSDTKFHLDSLDDECSMFLNDLGLSKKGKLSNAKYMAILEENFDDVFPELYNVTLNTDKETIYFYSGGTIGYKKDSRIVPSINEYKDILKYLGKYNSLLKDFDLLEPIGMEELKVVKHPLSDFYLVVDYIKENKESLPTEIQEALNKGLEKEILRISENHKNKAIYGKL